MRMTLLLAILVLSFAVGAGAARAQDYPTKAIKLVMPFVPGSPVDAVGRVIMQHLQGRLGQSIVIENRPGGGTTLGAKAAAVAAPDGYTLLFIGPNLAYYPVLFPNLDFDPKSLTPVATTVTWSHVYGVASPVPAKTIAELVTHAKANPGKLAFGYGLATMPHVIGEIFHRAAGLDIINVPYRGGEGARADLLGGRIHINVAPVPQMMPLIRDDKIRPLAYTGVQRDPDLPDVPTMIESGFPQVGFHPDVWMAIFAPALKRFGYQTLIKTPAEFAAFHESELQRMPPVLRAAGIAAQ